MFIVLVINSFIISFSITIISVLPDLRLVSGLRHFGPASQAQNTVQAMALDLQFVPLQADFSHPHCTICNIFLHEPVLFLLAQHGASRYFRAILFPSMILWTEWRWLTRHGCQPLCHLAMCCLDIFGYCFSCAWQSRQFDRCARPCFLPPHS